MKKFLLLSMVAISYLTGAAQTASNPLPFVIGEENKYEYSGGYSTPVFMYTAPEDQMVTVTPNRSDISMKVTLDGNAYSSKIHPSVKYGNDYLFIIQKDQSLYLNVTTYSSPVILTAAAKPYAYNLGVSADNAIAITTASDPMFIPFREENYKEVPVYLKYIASEDGALVLQFSGYVHNASYAENKDGEFIGIACTNSGGEYRTFIPVTAGNEYYICASSTAAKMLTATLEHPVFGESADFPIVITGTEAEIPAKAGKFYYDITGTESGYAVISSDITDFDGSVSWGQGINASSMVTISDGTFDIRQRSTKGGHYFVIIDKKSATPSTQKFKVCFEPDQDFDSFSKANNAAEGSKADITLGQDTKIPPYAATYYFRIKTPDTGAYVLNVAPKTAFTDKNSTLRLFKSSNSSTAVYIGEPDINYEVEAATTYILEVKVADADKRNFIVASIDELKQGDGASNPFIVKQGNNTLTAGNAKYFLYKAEKSSWVVITPADMSINAPTITRLKDAQSSYEQTVTILRHGDAHRFEAEAGRSYLIRFTKVKEDTSFDFTTPDYAQGESIENPFTITGPSFTVPTEPGVYWWSYTPERAGKLTISTDLKYDVVSSPTRSNAVKLYSADGKSVLTSLVVDYTNEIFNPAQYNVAAGTSYLIQVTSVSTQENKTVTLELGDLDPGETPAVAIQITHDTAPFTYPMAKNPGGFATGRWYAIDLVEGELSVYSKSSISFYFYPEREDNNYTSLNYKYYASSFWADASYTTRCYGMQNKKISEPGRYLMTVYYLYNDADVTFEGTALGKSTTGIGNIEQTPETAFTVNGKTITANADILVYDLSGRLAATIPTGESAQLPAGIYVAKSATGVAKVLLR